MPLRLPFHLGYQNLWLSQAHLKVFFETAQNSLFVNSEKNVLQGSLMSRTLIRWVVFVNAYA